MSKLLPVKVTGNSRTGMCKEFQDRTVVVSSTHGHFDYIYESYNHL